MMINLESLLNVLLVFIVITVICAIVIAYQAGVHDTRREAVQHGVAYHTYEDGEVIFHWGTHPYYAAGGKH